MKKLAALMMGLAFLTVTVTPMFAQQDQPKAEKKKKGKKGKTGKKKGATEKKAA